MPESRLRRKKAFTPPTTPRNQDPVKIGFISPLSGAIAQAGKDMLEGLKLAFEQIGYQKESTSVRNSFLAGAYELRSGIRCVEQAGRTEAPGPDTANANYNLACCYSLAGKLDDAFATSDDTRLDKWIEWGLLPFWWKPSDKTPKRSTFQRKVFNSKSETADKLPTFREAFKRRRCLRDPQGLGRAREGEGPGPAHHL